MTNTEIQPSPREQRRRDDDRHLHELLRQQMEARIERDTSSGR